MSSTIELEAGGVVGISCGPVRTVRLALHDPPRFVERLLSVAEARELAEELLRRSGRPAMLAFAELAAERERDAECFRVNLATREAQLAAALDRAEAAEARLEAIAAVMGRRP